MLEIHTNKELLNGFLGNGERMKEFALNEKSKGNLRYLCNSQPNSGLHCLQVENELSLKYEKLKNELLLQYLLKKINSLGYPNNSIGAIDIGWQ